MIITLTGTNAYQLRIELRKLVQNFVKQHTDMGLEQYDGEDLDPNRLPSILQALPFLAEKRMVVLRNPSAQKAIQERLEQLLDEVSDSTELIIVEPKPDKRTSYYKALQKKTDLREYKELDEHGLAKWLVDEARRLDATLSSSDAQFLVQRVGTNQMLLSNELKKLSNFSSTINRESILELTEPTPQSSVFDLVDAAMNGRRQQVIKIYQEQRQQKVEPMAILGMLAWQLHILALVKTAGGRSASDIASQAKINPYVVRKTQDIARHCTLTQLKRWVSDAATLDVRLKREPVDADEALMHFLLSLSE